MLDVFVGTYTYKDYPYNIVREDDNMFIISPFTGSKIKVLPETNNTLFAPDFDFQFEISKDDNNQIKYCQVLFGSRLEMQKIK